MSDWIPCDFDDVRSGDFVQSNDESSSLTGMLRGTAWYLSEDGDTWFTREGTPVLLRSSKGIHRVPPEEESGSLDGLPAGTLLRVTEIAGFPVAGARPLLAFLDFRGFWRVSRRANGASVLRDREITGWSKVL